MRERTPSPGLVPQGLAITCRLGGGLFAGEAPEFGPRPAVRANALKQGFALDAREDEVRRRAEYACFVERDDVGVVQLRDDLRLVEARRRNVPRAASASATTGTATCGWDTAAGTTWEVAK